MHRGRAGDDVARREPRPLVALPVGDHAPGLAHEQRRRRRRPTCRGSARSSRRTRPAAVHARSRLAAPARRRSSNVAQRPLEHREVLVEPLALGAEREARSRGSRARRGASTHADAARRRGTRRRPGAPSRRSPSIGACTTPTTGSPSATSPIDTPTDREAVQEVGGAVERVDEPADVGALAAAPPRRRTRCSGAASCEHATAPRARSRCRRRSPSRPAPSRGRSCARAEARRRTIAPPAPAASTRDVEQAVEVEVDVALTARPRRAARRAARACPPPTSWRRASASATTSVAAAASTTAAPASRQTSRPPR